MLAIYVSGLMRRKEESPKKMSLAACSIRKYLTGDWEERPGEGFISSQAMDFVLRESIGKFAKLD